MTTYRADWVFPGKRPPIRDGVIEVVDRMICSVQPYRTGTKIDVDLGHSLVTPGFVNAHTHLDLGELRNKLSPPSSFTDWLKSVIDYRKLNDLAEWDQAINNGIEESFRAGTTKLCDISVGGRSAILLAASNLDAEVCLELIGLGETRWIPLMEQANEWLSANHQTPQRALSPHAPYTVSFQLLQMLADSFPISSIAMHVAETSEELELLNNQSGSFRQLLEGVGAWHPQNLVRSIDELLEKLDAFEELKIIHGNYLTQEQWQRLTWRGKTVVYCPRTHAYFGHSPHPYLQMMADGVHVALGTDSLASNPDLSILNECRYLWQRDRALLTGETLLRLGTDSHVPRIAALMFATFVAIPYETDVLDPWDALWSGAASPSAVCTYGTVTHFS